MGEKLDRVKEASLAGTSGCCQKRIDFLGCPVDSLTTQEVLDRIDGFVSCGGAHQITPINASKLSLMRGDPILRELVVTSDVIIPEYAVVWGAKVLGTPVAEHVAGIMLMRSILEVAPSKGYRIYFLGAAEEIVARMVHKLNIEYSGLNIVGYHNGYFDTHKEEAILAEIDHKRPDILFVAMGTPKQEIWIRQKAMPLGVPVSMGVGGSFDVFAGLRKETPSWMRHGFEWIYRLAQDPKHLWKRYLTTNPELLYRVLIARMFGSHH